MSKERQRWLSVVGCRRARPCPKCRWLPSSFSPILSFLPLPGETLRAFAHFFLLLLYRLKTIHTTFYIGVGATLAHNRYHKQKLLYASKMTF